MSDLMLEYHLSQFECSAVNMTAEWRHNGTGLWWHRTRRII